MSGFLEDHVPTRESALDIGSNVGFFTFALADFGVPTIGVELMQRLHRIAEYGRVRSDCEDAAFLNMDVNQRTLRLLPHVDVTVLLSVWHHWVRDDGIDTASDLLSKLWDHTGEVLFFETGERELAPRYGLDILKSDAKAWLVEYLASTCQSGEVVHLGEFEVIDGSQGSRNLFAIRRG